MIIVRIWEGLGNQLFQYAFARKLQTMGKKVYLDIKEDHTSDYSYFYSEREYLLSHFNIKWNEAPEEKLQKYSYIQEKTKWDKIRRNLSELNLWKNKYIEEKNAWEYHGEYENLRGNYYLKGWFQRPFFFQDIRNELLEEITLKEDVNIPEELKNLLKSSNTVSVHIRRGDYKISAHSFLPIQYYKKGIQYMDLHIENPQYLIFSTDMEWVKEKLGNHVNYHYIDEYGKFKDYEELMIMSRCANNIICNSTFSWWAAWLNQNPDKIVLAPNGWSGSKKVSDCMVLKDWVRI